MALYGKKQVKTKTYIGAKLFEWQKAVVDEICDQRGTNKVVVCKETRRPCFANGVFVRFGMMQQAHDGDEELPLGNLLCQMKNKSLQNHLHKVKQQELVLSNSS